MSRGASFEPSCGDFPDKSERGREKEIAGTRFVNFKSQHSSRRFANISVKLPACAAQSRSRIEIRGIATNKLQRVWAAGEIPMAITRRGGSAVRVAFSARLFFDDGGGSLRQRRAWRLLFLQLADRHFVEVAGGSVENRSMAGLEPTLNATLFPNSALRKNGPARTRR